MNENKEREAIQPLITFPFPDEQKQILLNHGCTFVEGNVWTVFFPQGTTRKKLYEDSACLLGETTYYRILLPDGLEMREIATTNETTILDILLSNHPPKS